MPRLRILFLLCLLALITASLAPAQQRKKASNPFLTQGQPAQWDTRREIHLFAATFKYRGAGGRQIPQTGIMEFESVKFVAPMIEGCSSASMDPSRFASSLAFEHEDIDTEAELIPDLQCEEQVGVWEGANLSGQKMSLKIVGKVTTYKIEINERAANSVQWPTNGFPETVADCLEPQFFVESDDEAVIALMNRWTANNPQGPPPYMVAKAIAGMMQEQFQVTGNIKANNYPGRFGGMNVSGAAQVARSLRGTESDQAALLCAIYRAAGLPARVVIGWDVAGSPGGREHVPVPSPICRAVFDPDIASHAVLRTWVEFYLYDEARQRGGWIPVDVYMIRQSSNRMGNLERKWDGFGGGMCYDHLIPITFHFVPPQSVVAAEDPALWGWAPEPSPQSFEQTLIFDAMPAVQRGAHRR